MRQTAARLNRAWLTVIGLLLLIAGVLAVMISTGLGQSAVTAAGGGTVGPARTDRVAGQRVADFVGSTWVLLSIALAGIVLAFLALGWLVAQIPRTNPAKPFRLHDDLDTGLTRCAPGVLTDAVEAQVTALPGVHRCSAVLRGTASEPDLTIKVTADDRTALPRLLDTLHNKVATDLGLALDTRLRRLGVQIEVDAGRSRTDQITV